MKSIVLVNKRNASLDLSAVKDTSGKTVILMPEGHPGAQRECFSDVLDHPNVKTFKDCGWLEVQDEFTKEIVEVAPATTAKREVPVYKDEPALESKPDEVKHLPDLVESMEELKTAMTGESPVSPTAKRQKKN